MSTSTHQPLRTEILSQNRTPILTPFIFGIFGTLLFYLLSPYFASKHFLLHAPTLLFLWLCSTRSTEFSASLAIIMGLLTEVLLSLTIGSGVFVYGVSYAVIRMIEPLWNLHYRFHRMGYGIVFIGIWHVLFWIMH